MIYGRNFNGTAIPEGVTRNRFAATIRVVACGHHTVERGRRGQLTACSHCHTDKRIEHARLVGVGQSAEERDAMIVIATNGHRRLFIQPRGTAGGTWYGIYSF